MSLYAKIEGDEEGAAVMLIEGARVFKVNLTPEERQEFAALVERVAVRFKNREFDREREARVNA